MKPIDGVSFGGRTYKVIQQPQGKPEVVYITAKQVRKFTQFSLAPEVGLLAHNDAIILRLKVGQNVVTWEGDMARLYRVIDIADYQALEPDNPHGKFESVPNELSTNYKWARMTAEWLFDFTYGSYPLVLQTCIERDGCKSWGRRFVCCERATDTCEAGERHYDQPA